MSEKGRLVKNTGLIAIGNFGAKMISFLLLPLYTSILSTNEYGTYDYIVAISAFLLPIATTSMHEAMFRFIIDSGNNGIEFKRIISNAFFVVIIGIASLGIIMGFLSLTLKLENVTYIWLYVAASALYTFSNNLLRGLGKIKEYAIVSSGKNILQLVLNVVVVAVLRWGMQGLLFSLCISEVLSFVAVASISKLCCHINPRYLSFWQIKQMLRYSLPLVPNALCAQVINLSDRLIISNVMGSSANGIYSVSYKFPNMIETVYHYFYTAWSESASRVFAKGKDEATKFYQSLYEAINNLMFSVILLMIAAMPIMFRLFIRGSYIQGFQYVPLLMFAMYFDSMAKFYSGLFTALKKTNVMAISTIVAAIINVTINLLFIEEYGLFAAAGSTLVADIVLVVIRRYFIVREIKLRINIKKILVELVFSVLILWLFSYNDCRKIVVSISISLVYAVIANRDMVKKFLKYK